MVVLAGAQGPELTPPARADETTPKSTSPAGERKAPQIDAARAFGYLTKICDIGPRISGSNGMDRQQQLIAEHFGKLKAQVRFQSFDAPHPQTRTPVRMNNMIVSWDPQATERVLIACHYDTRPRPDRDANQQLALRGTFLGANDGASGVALLMEMAHHMPEIRPKYGVDFVFFDGEELVYHPADPYFLGSEYFAREYRDKPPAYKYHYGVVVDMIGDKDLQLFLERNSMDYAPELTRSIWKKAKELNVREFIGREKHDVRDDHLALNEIAKIPACDIIDFNYDHWHTTKDVPANCSGASLAKVARVLLAWLEDVPDPSQKPEKKRPR
ncbi:MAG: M28 family peptidase [Planctomycetes bacterium]|nr:M28 family peptidase [Planctomycetota bacterium]